MKKIFALLTTAVLLLSVLFATVELGSFQKWSTTSSYVIASNIKTDAAIPVSSSGNQPGHKS